MIVNGKALAINLQREAYARVANAQSSEGGFGDLFVASYDYAMM